jgi:hypothetical protein
VTVNRHPPAKRANLPGSRSAVLGARGRLLMRILLTGLLGVVAALLVACGSSGKGLIPTANAGPLQSDFEAVAQAAESGEGSCTATEAAIAKTESDFAALPSSVDKGLRKTLTLGIANLRRRALALCAQPLPQSTSTTTPTTTTSTQTTPTTTTPTETTPTTPTTSTPTTPTATTPGGGTPAPGSESEPGAASGPGGGTGIGGESGAGGGAGGSGQGAGK